MFQTLISNNKSDISNWYSEIEKDYTSFSLNHNICCGIRSSNSKVIYSCFK